MEARSALALALAALVLAPPAQAGPPFTATLQGPFYILVGDQATFTVKYGIQAGVLVPAPARNVQLYVNDEPADASPALSGTTTLLHVFPARGAYAVRAVAEEGLPTSGESATRTVYAAVAPGAPRSVAAAPEPGSLSARVSWQPPADDGGAPIASYLVQRQLGNGAFITRGSASASARSFVDGGLVLGSSYTYRVLATNYVATGPGADARIVGDVPPAPTVEAHPVPQSQSVRVWVNGSGATQALAIERSYDGSWWTSIASGSGFSLTATDALWMPATPVYRAFARSVVGDSPAAIAPVTGPLPGAPANVAVTIPRDVRLAWSAPASGGVVQAYQVREHGNALVTLSWSATSADVALGVGEHDLTVVALNAVGEGPASAPVRVTLARAANVSSLAATVTEEVRFASVNLSWGAPPSDGGAPIVGYHVYRTASGGARSLVGDLPSSARWLNLTQVAPGIAYVFEVAPVTTVGDGDAASVNVTIASYQWALTFDLAGFRACETVGGSTTCTTVAPGGTYHRTGSGVVSYGVTYNGTLTRRGVPTAGQPVDGLIQESWDVGGELAESFTATTNAAGAYATSSRRDATLTPQPGCSTASFDASAGFDTTGVRRTGDAFLICPT